jgi:hypothetical protein
MRTSRRTSGQRRRRSPQFEALEARATPTTLPAGFTEATVATGIARGLIDREADRAGALHTLNGTGTVETINHAAPLIQALSAGLTVNEGQTATFTIAASGSGMSYQWEHLVGASWVDVGTDSPEYTVPTVTTADAGEYRVIISGAGTSEVSVPIDLTVDVGRVPRWTPGLDAEFFAFPTRLQAMPRLTGRADVTRTDPVIDYLPTGHSWPGLDARFDRNFAARETGLVEISTPGRYKFTLRSEDGSRLWVDGKPLVNNAGVHPMRGRARSLTLTAGLHTIQVESFAGAPGAGLILSWSGPGISEQVVPADHLFHASGAAGGSPLG